MSATPTLPSELTWSSSTWTVPTTANNKTLRSSVLYFFVFFFSLQNYTHTLPTVPFSLQNSKLHSMLLKNRKIKIKIKNMDKELFGILIISINMLKHYSGKIESACSLRCWHGLQYCYLSWAKNTFITRVNIFTRAKLVMPNPLHTHIQLGNSKEKQHLLNSVEYVKQNASNIFLKKEKRNHGKKPNPNYLENPITKAKELDMGTATKMS